MKKATLFLTVALMLLVIAEPLIGACGKEGKATSTPVVTAAPSVTSTPVVTPTLGATAPGTPTPPLGAVIKIGE